MSSEDLELPERCVLLHIGPHKTGTTAIQSAFHHNREALERHGVHYAGREQQVYLEARTVVGTPISPGRRRPKVTRWDALVEEVAEATAPRVVVSGETFCQAEGAAIDRILADLGRSRPVHVVVTLRPLTKILPSQWQQLVQNGQRSDYAPWLAKVFNAENDRSRARRFWLRHDHAAVVQRWAAAVGADQLTVVVVDDSDRSMLARTFARMLDLPDGVLVAPSEVVNRSLTAAEIELVRRINVAAVDAEWAKVARFQILKSGVSDSMQSGPAPVSEAALTTPRWALERATAVAAEAGKAIESLGVRIVGDITRLSDMPNERAIRGEDYAPPASLPMDAAVLAVLGAITGMGLARRRLDAAAAAAAAAAGAAAGAEAEPASEDD